MIFYLCRHGQTVANRDQIMSGQIDTPLTDQGLFQGTENGLRLYTYLKMKNQFINGVYSSDLGRAFITATRMATQLQDRLLNHRVNTSEKIREMTYGSYTYKPIDWVKANSDYYDINYRFPLGECFVDVRTRASAFIEKLAEQYPKETLLIVAHSGVIRAINDSWGQYAIEDGKNRKVGHNYIGRYDVDSYAELNSYQEISS